MTQALPTLEVLQKTHAFFLELLQRQLGHAVPVPTHANSGDANGLIPWLNLLDLAITPPMMRDALREQHAANITGSLLTYYVSKATRTDTDRDKCDFIVTSLFRSPDPPELWDARGLFFGGGKTYPLFEPHLVKMLGLTAIPGLPDEHRQLIREFDFLAEEVEDYRHFDALIDSGVMQKVRDIKHSLGTSFYHPKVLAVIAAYNVFFGTRFDRLFREATQQMKEFAAKVQAEGGSIMTRVDGDVIVKQLADVQEEKILENDYGKAQDDFRQLSKFKKAVDHRRGLKEASAAAASAHPASRRPSIMPSSPIELNGNDSPNGSMQQLTPSPSLSLEESKLREMAETIRNFVRAADPKSAHVVPVRFGNLSLSTAEVDAFRAEYSGEKSFRADYVNVLTEIMSLIGRMGIELAEFKSKRTSAYLWKPHADSLSNLLAIGRETNARAITLAELAERRGLKEKVAAVHESLAKLRDQVQTVAAALQTLGTPTRDVY